jgi:hypothetical protein
VPIPRRTAVCGELPSLSMMLIEAAKVVAPELLNGGLKITEIEQIELAPSDVPHVLVCENVAAPFPTIDRPEIEMGVAPVLESTRFCAVEIVPCVAENDKSDGSNVAAVAELV